MSEYDYDRYEEIMRKLLNDMLRDPDYLEIGENISDIPEVKIIFDGYGALETDDEYIENGNKNMESYAIFIHKNSGKKNFEFPEHELTPWALVHRPNEEVCIYAWYDVEKDDWTINSLYETSDHKMTDKQVMKILEKLNDRYFKEEE